MLAGNINSGSLQSTDPRAPFRFPSAPSLPNLSFFFCSLSLLSVSCYWGHGGIYTCLHCPVAVIFCCGKKTHQMKFFFISFDMYLPVLLTTCTLLCGRSLENFVFFPYEHCHFTKIKLKSYSKGN